MWGPANWISVLIRREREPACFFSLPECTQEEGIQAHSEVMTTYKLGEAGTG